MLKSATRERCAEAPSRDLWQHVPLELAAAAVFVIAAACLTLAGIFP